MKKLIKSIIFAVFIFSSIVLVAQSLPPDPHSDPKNDPSGSELGGNAPIGAGITLLLVLGAAYGGRKTYLLTKNDKAAI